MTTPPAAPYQPYAAAHVDIKGPGDARPTALQVVHHLDLVDKLHGKTILITGCSSGLGIETARALYETGARLFLTARDLPKLRAVIEDIAANSPAGDKSRPLPQAIELHLNSLQSVRQAAEDILAKTGGMLHSLILNGGVMAGKLTYTSDGLETQIGVNHFAGFLLCRILQPALAKAARDAGTASRVVILSSAAHAWSPIHFRDLHWKRYPMTYNQWQTYASSKTANIYTARAIDRKFASRGIRAWSVHPGGITTGLARNLQGADFEGFGDVEEIFRFYKSVEQGAATTVMAALDPKLESDNGGMYLADCGVAVPAKDGDRVDGPGYAEHAYDEEAEEELWLASCETVNVADTEV